MGELEVVERGKVGESFKEGSKRDRERGRERKVVGGATLRGTKHMTGPKVGKCSADKRPYN